MILIHRKSASRLACAQAVGRLLHPLYPRSCSQLKHTWSIQDVPAGKESFCSHDSATAGASAVAEGMMPGSGNGEDEGSRNGTTKRQENQ